MKTLQYEDLHSYLLGNRFSLVQSDLKDEGWIIAPPDSLNLINRLAIECELMESRIGDDVHYGIKTGLNEAFIIDKRLGNKLIRQDPASEKLLEPIITGREISRYEALSHDYYLVSIPKGWTERNAPKESEKWGWFQGEYPAIAEHLHGYEERAKRRHDQGDYWWELRACSYYGEFRKTKIVYLVFQTKPIFTYDTTGVYVNNSLWIIPGSDKILVSILNSKLGWFLISHYCTRIQRGHQLIYEYIKRIPIRSIDEDNVEDVQRREAIVERVDRMLDLHAKHADATTDTERTQLQEQIDTTDAEIDRLVYELYGLSEEDIAIVEGDVFD